MDSAGAMTMRDVQARLAAFDRVLKPETERGVHMHNNLALAVANSIVGVECGATRVDGSLGGIGAGAGNAAIEAFVAAATSWAGSTARSREILAELGRRKMVGGQEDMIVDVALDLKQKVSAHPERR